MMMGVSASRSNNRTNLEQASSVDQTPHPCSPLTANLLTHPNKIVLREEKLIKKSIGPPMIIISMLPSLYITTIKNGTCGFEILLLILNCFPR